MNFREVAKTLDTGDANQAYRLAARWGDDAGSNTEWSLVCPGSGMAADCCSLLTSVFAFDVVAAASRVGPAGSTPITVVLGVAAGEEFKGMPALMGGGTLSEQPTPMTAKTATKAALARWRAKVGLFALGMMDPACFISFMIALQREPTNRMQVLVRVGITPPLPPVLHFRNRRRLFPTSHRGASCWTSANLVFTLA